MAVVALFVALVGLVLLEVSYRLFLVALHWILPVWAALAAAYFVVSLHLSDPMASLWTFLATALAVRFLMGRLRDWLVRRALAF